MLFPHPHQSPRALIKPLTFPLQIDFIVILKQSNSSNHDTDPRCLEFQKIFVFVIYLIIHSET